jgi:FemAB-related protein (PEP-CTERM system-associated)
LSEPAPLRIHRLDSTQADQVARWDAFVLAQPQATFFHRAGWQTVIRDVFRHDTYFLYADSGGEIQGVLPLAHVNSRLAVELGTDHLELRHIERRHTDWPVQELYVTFRKAILPKEEDNMLAIPRKQRAMVRKGIKNGLTSHIDPSVDRFFALYADNVHRHGTPAMPKRYFQTLLKTFGADAEVLTVCSAEGRPLSSVLSFYFRDEVLPYYAGDDEAARDLAANDFKYWELMRLACARGLKVFDYGRSKEGTGPYAFKKNWGFEPTPLNYEYRLYKRESIPQNNPANAKYKLLIATWRRLPIGVANWLGPFIVRNLG